MNKTITLMGLSVIFSTILIGTFQAQAEEYEITIPRGGYSPQCVQADSCFVPSSLQIPENSIVEWENKDHAPHTIVSGNGQSDSVGLFASRVLNHDDEFYFDFSNLGPGSYPYYCSIHPWMKGEIIVGEIQVSDQPPQAKLSDDLKKEYSIADKEEKNQPEMKMEHTPSNPSLDQNLGNYSLRLDWIHEFPVTGEVNGFELIVTDSSKGKMMMSGGSCGGESHDGSMGHGSQNGMGMMGGMGGHEGGCPHFNMVKKSVPKVAALEAGVENLENSLNMEIIVLGKSYPVSLNKDSDFNGRYYVLFIPTVAAQYDVHVSGMIDTTPINVNFSPSKVIEKSIIQQIP